MDAIACCSPVTDSPLDAEQAEILAVAFAALADPVRLRLFSCIAAAPPGEMCACELGPLVERSQPTISHHMKVLVDAGLVSRAKRGQWVWYSVEADRLEALRAVLA